MSDYTEKQLAFNLSIALRSLKYYCITGAVGITYIAAVCLIYAERKDATFYIKLILWFAFGIFNILIRFYYYLTWLRGRDLFSAKDRSPMQLFEMQKKGRVRLACLSGSLWGGAGLLFIGSLNTTGQLLLIFALVAQTFNGIPGFISTLKIFVMVWVMFWLPLIFMMRADPILIYLLVFSCISLLSSLFICLTLWTPVNELFTLKETSSDKAMSLDKDNEQLKMFFLAANHDLSQPISAIQHAIHNLARHAKEADFIEAPLDVIRTSTSSLTRLIEDIIHFERITSGLSKADLAPVNLNDVFKRVIARCDHLSTAKEIGLWARPTNRRVMADGYVLERVLVNLVENALRYTVHGSVILAARPRGEQVSIEVWDSGLGMGDEEMGHIFEVFYRREATKDMHQGYGLGLSIVKRLSESMGAAIQVRSKPGRGSVFKLMLPAVEGTLTANAIQASPVSIRAGNIIEGMKIAVLDDDKVLLNSMADALRGESALVTAATTQKELALLIAEDPLGYDVMIIDWNLRIGTGESAFNELKNIAGFSPAWLVISGDISADKEAGLIGQGIPVIRKPFAPEEVAPEIQTVV